MGFLHVKIIYVLSFLIMFLPASFGLRLSVPKEILAKDAMKVVYAVMATRSETKAKLLGSQFETWAPRPFSNGRYFAEVGVGPDIKQFIPEKYHSALLETSCEDSVEGRACKNFEALKEGVKRDADWLVLVNEDNYVHTARLEKALADVYREHPEYKTSPVLLGIKGCALSGCPALPEAKSVCGGGGLMLNRAALLLFFRDGELEYSNHEYSKRNAPSGYADDVVTACVLQTLGGEVIDWHQGLLANRLFSKAEIDNAIDEHPLVLHYMITPEVMNYVHSKINGEENINTTNAFDDHGCLSGERYPYETEGCHPGRAVFIQTSQRTNFYDEMAHRYIDRRKIRL